jgi:hypothetical protein
VKIGLTKRVETFSKNCTENGIYELSEDYLLRILSRMVRNRLHTYRRELKDKFLTSPEPEYAGKGTYGLVDGTKGFKITT